MRRARTEQDAPQVGVNTGNGRAEWRHGEPPPREFVDALPVIG